jgi:hypothetical protein
MIGAIALVFIWGFSKRTEAESPQEADTAETKEIQSVNTPPIESLAKDEIKEAQEISERR